jgi:hypothetical protein
MTSGVTSRTTCRGTRTRGEGEVVNDEPARGGVIDDERDDELRDEPRDVQRHPDARRCRSSRRRASRCRVVDNEKHEESRDEPRDVPRQPDARRRRSSQRRACATWISQRRAVRQAV